MSKNMNKKQNEKETRRFLEFALLIFLLLLPVFIIALYNRPSADDFGYSLLTHAAFVKDGVSPASLLNAAMQTDVYYYNNWQGLYSSAFLLSLQPAIFGEKWYALTTFLVIGCLFVCLWGSLHLILGKQNSMHRMTAPALALLLTYAFVEGMPNPVEGLFWFNGAMNYIPFFALTLFNGGVILRLSQEKGYKALAWTILSCVIAFVVSGGHQVAALLNLMLIFLALIIQVPKKRFWTAAPLAVGLAGLLFNLSSPGTAVRVSGFQSASMPEAIVKSFVLAVFSLIRWLDVPLLCLLTLLLPLAVRLAQKDCPLFNRPWMAIATGFVLVWAMLWLPSYTMGGIGPGRLINVVWMTFVLSACVSEVAFVGWLVQKKHIDFSRFIDFGNKHSHEGALAGAALILCMACIGGDTVKEGLDNHFGTTLEAVYELAEGKPQAYAAALDERAERLTDPETENVIIRCLNDEEKPYLLYFSDVVSGPDQWGLAEYYGKNSVIVE